MGLIELLFAFIVVAAVVAVLFDPETGGLIVMTIALGAAFYQLALMVGPSIWLAVFAVFVAAAVKIADEASGADMLGNVSLIQMADRVLTRLQGGGRRRTGGQERTDTGNGETRIWTDQEDDDD